MVRYCPECGGELEYDPTRRFFSCKSCGVTFSHQELVEAKDERRPVESEDEAKKREMRDYLKWWLMSREEKKRR